MKTLLLMSLIVQVPETGWKPWSHRADTSAKTDWDASVKRSGRASLRVSGGGNAIVHGGWENEVSGLKPDTWYRFSAVYKQSGVSNPEWQIVPRLDWRDGSGKRTGQPDYVYQQKGEGEWTRTWIEAQSPGRAAGVAVQLFLSHAANGTVWWDEVKIEEIAPPAARKLKVATIHHRLSKTKSREENVEKFVETALGNVEGDADVILFPEGMTVVGNGKSYVEVAESIPGPTTKRLGELARQKKSYIVAGIYEGEGKAVYNTAVLIDRKGNVAGKYRKVYLPREEYERGLTPGKSFPVFDTDFGRVGIMICYDVFFPDPAKALAAQGAEMILLPIWGGDETLAKARAIENRIFLVTSGYDHPTYVMDPDGERLSQAPVNGTAAIATIDLNRRYTHPHLGDMRNRRMKEARTDVMIPAPRVDR